VGIGPIQAEDGRIKRPIFRCSIACASQPAQRAMAKNRREGFVIFRNEFRKRVTPQPDDPALTVSVLSTVAGAITLFSPPSIAFYLLEAHYNLRSSVMILFTPGLSRDLDPEIS